jgi:XPG I-region
MGIRGLFSYCKKHLKTLNINKDLNIGIDTSSILYRFKGNFEMIYDFLNPILENKLLFVFEGKAPKYKEKEIELRAEARHEYEKKIELLKESLNKDLNEETKNIIKERIKELELESWTLTFEVIQNFKNFLKLKNLRYVKSNSEADLLLIDLYHHKIIDVVLSNDMDYLTAGIKKMYINYYGELMELNLNEILDDEDINVEQFKDIAVLSRIIQDIDLAFKYVRHYGSVYIMINNYNKFQNINYNDDILKIKERYTSSNKYDVYLKIEHKYILDEFMGR